MSIINIKKIQLEVFLTFLINLKVIMFISCINPLIDGATASVTKM